MYFRDNFTMTSIEDTTASSSAGSSSSSLQVAEAMLAALHVSGPVVAFFCFHCRACAQQRWLWEDSRYWPLALAVPAVAFTYLGFYVGCLVTDKCMRYERSRPWILVMFLLYLLVFAIGVNNMRKGMLEQMSNNNNRQQQRSNQPTDTVVVIDLPEPRTSLDPGFPPSYTAVARPPPTPPPAYEQVAKNNKDGTTEATTTAATGATTGDGIERAESPPPGYREAIQF